MELIKSFTVDHDFIKEGIYLSRKDKNTVTYDIRVKIPNADDYLTPPVAHTAEHLCATYVRNSRFSDEIVYFGPMGCMTGFYLVTFDTLSYKDAIELIREAFDFIANYKDERIPGTNKKECGNYLSHDKEGAILMAKKYVSKIANWTEDMLEYPQA